MGPIFGRGCTVDRGGGVYERFNTQHHGHRRDVKEAMKWDLSLVRPTFNNPSLHPEF
jgi:hypothetical protein